MPAPISDAKRRQIIDLCEQGTLSRNAIARETGVSPATVTNVATTIGHRFAQMHTSRAHEAARSYGAERRATLAAKFAQRAEELLDAMDGDYLVFNFGGRDNTYEEHTLSAPPTEAKRQMMQAAREGMRTVLDIDRHDNRNDEDVDAVSRWLRDIIGGS